MNELKNLIEELEREQANLRRLIEESVEMREFLIAHYHSQALGHVSRQLQTFRNFDDREFDKKSRIKSLIKNSETQLQMDYPEKVKYYFESQIIKYKQELNHLNKQPKLSVPESDLLKRHLESLVKNKIKIMRIVLKRDSFNFIVAIKKYRSGLKVSIPSVKLLRRNYIIHDENICHFLALGFTLDKRESNLTLMLLWDKNEILKEMLKILSIIVFEIFYFKEFEGDTFIEISE